VNDASLTKRQVGNDVPSFAFNKIKDAVLGKSYDLSLIITDARRMKKLNTIYRDKETATDILSFPISENEGEIYICPSQTRKQMKGFDRSYDNFFIFLFIHGCTHLKGYDHGAIMESIEAKIRKDFGI
jgi:probable rRNA maturation factor